MSSKTPSALRAVSSAASKPLLFDLPALFLALFWRSKWLKGTNRLQTWLRLQLSFQKWQGADLSAWHWAIGHHPWQMCNGTKVAGSRGRQNAFSQDFFLSVITAGPEPVKTPKSLLLPSNHAVFTEEHSVVGVYSSVNWTNYCYFIINVNFILLL